MTREEALAQLNATSAHTRGLAARALSTLGRTADLSKIRRALRSETVSHVNYALQDTIQHIERKQTPHIQGPDNPELISDEVRRQIYGQAVQWVAGALLHEIASPIGLVRHAARRELKENWETSATKRHLESVGRVFEAIEKLKNAAGVPKSQEFDLAALIDELIADFPEAAANSISAIGARPFLIKGDHSLIRMVVVNGLRNAVEAQQTAAQGAGAHDVTVNWGKTDVDYWVSILDHGDGIYGPAETAFQIGNSTKKNHTGFGLAIARQAVETMIGTVTLEPAKDGGALYEARWRK